LVAADLETLSSLAESEVGKPSWETITAELMPLIASCRWHARRAGRILKDRRLPGRPWWLLGQRGLVRRVPLGRVGIIGTWNYPIQLLGIQIVQAVVGGNQVVVKPSERSPKTQRRLIELAWAAGLSREDLVVMSSDRMAGGRLLQEPHLDHVVFTGSTAVGTRVAESAAGRLLPTTLELSGCDSAIVLDDADPVVAARSIWASVTMNAGQTCMAPRRVLVHADRHAAFAAALVPLAAGAGCEISSTPPRRIGIADSSKMRSNVAADQPPWWPIRQTDGGCGHRLFLIVRSTRRPLTPSISAPCWSSVPGEPKPSCSPCIGEAENTSPPVSSPRIDIESID
jgi:acyl-CoA reductase-like NAD-dependent aldehyde dehydrogenase